MQYAEKNIKSKMDIMKRALSETHGQRRRHVEASQSEMEYNEAKGRREVCAILWVCAASFDGGSDVWIGWVGEGGGERIPFTR